MSMDASKSTDGGICTDGCMRAGCGASTDVGISTSGGMTLFGSMIRIVGGTRTYGSTSQAVRAA